MSQIRRILQLKIQGHTNRSIAKTLHMGRDTVNAYMLQVNGLNKSEKDLLKLSDEELGSLIYKELPAPPNDWHFSDLQGRIPYLCDELSKPKTTRMILYLGMNRFTERLALSKLEGSYIKLLNQLEKISIIILDDFGLSPLEDHAKTALLLVSAFLLFLLAKPLCLPFEVLLRGGVMGV